VRGGAGIFYDRVGGDRFVHAAEAGDPYAQVVNYGPVNTQSNQTPWPVLSLGFTPRWFDPSSGLGSDLTNAGLDPHIHTPLLRQYSLGIQYEFAPHWVLELGYVGSSGINLVDAYHDYNAARLASAANPIDGQITNTLENLNSRVPYLGYIPSGLTITAFDGKSNYNSLQAAVRKHLSHGLSLQASYTWSKNLSDLLNNAGSFNGNVNDPNKLSQQVGPVSFSRPQRLIVNYSWDPPLGKHRGPSGKVLEGWNLSGVTTIQVGAPLTVTDSLAGSIYGMNGAYASTQTAQMCPGVTYPSAATSGGIDSRLGGVSGGPGYLKLSAFCAPPAVGDGTGFGNSGIGILPGPGQANFDVAAIKNTPIQEKQNLQFRAEFFNLFNHPQFGNPAVEVSSPGTFGQITTTVVNPRIVQFALKYIY